MFGSASICRIGSGKLAATFELILDSFVFDRLWRVVGRVAVGSCRLIHDLASIQFTTSCSHHAICFQASEQLKHRELVHYSVHQHAVA